MCNCYDLSNHHIPWHAELESVSDEVNSLLSHPVNIRKTDKGVVARSLDDKLKASPMRWGFHRSFNNSINNAREDKLDSGMWKTAWEQRRCVVPMDAYYEWSGPKGKKQTHAFVGDQDDLLWAAGLWEEDRELGLCYTVITVDPNPITKPIHSRMPALLSSGDIEEYLASEDPRNLMRPFEGPMKTFPCQNPLRMKEPVPPIPMEVDQELF